MNKVNEITNPDKAIHIKAIEWIFAGSIRYFACEFALGQHQMQLTYW